jgi:hypothetical protein
MLKDSIDIGIYCQAFAAGKAGLACDADGHSGRIRELIETGWRDGQAIWLLRTVHDATETVIRGR